MSDTARATPIDWSLIDHHLQTGAYETAAVSLEEAQLASAQANDAVMAATLAAIRQICLACHECRIKIDWYQQAITESEQREAELYNHAQALLSQISESSPRQSREIKMENGEPAHPPRQIAQHLPQNAARPMPVTIWTLLWLFLHNLRRQMGLLSDTPLQERSTFVPQTESMSDDGPSQVVDEWTVASIPLLTADGSAMTETQLPFPSLHTDALLEPPVATTAELATEPADKPTIEPTAEPAVEFIAEPTVERAVEATIEPTDDTNEPEIISITEDELPDESTVPSLVIYCLGTFQVYQDDQLVEEWPSSKGQLIFKYLLLHRERPVAKEFLMDRFWPDAPPDAARNNLNVAIYGLRRALRRGRPDFSQVLFRDDSYLLNPEMTIWVDTELFMHHIKTGQRLEQAGNLNAAIQEYQAAEALYQGEFMQEDRYEDWLLPMRQQVQERYLYVLERLATHYFKQADFEASIAVYNKMLAVDSCNEDAHCNLMRCYSQQGRQHLALRQYHRCVEALRRELDVEPAQPINALYAQLRQQ